MELSYLSEATKVTTTKSEQKKAPTVRSRLLEYGAPGTIRTCDRLIRSQVLYPAELQARGMRILWITPTKVKAIARSFLGF